MKRARIVSAALMTSVLGVIGGLGWAASLTAPAQQKKTYTKAQVEIQSPTGDPLTAGSASNQFTFTGTNGVATISVQATVTPSRASTNLSSQIKWSFTGLPAGVTVTWDHPWPGDPTSGQGVSAVATLTGYPANNGDFGVKTLNMTVVRKSDGKVFNQRSAKLALFYERDAVATGKTAPNWFIYYLQAIGGRANTAYGGASSNYGITPGMLNWSYGTAQDKTKIIIYDTAKTSDPGDPCDPRGVQSTTGIDTFEDTVRHENQHTVQIANADAVVGTAAGTPWRFGWSWNQGANHNHWGVGPDGKPGVAGVDDDANGKIDDFIVTGPGELGHGDDVALFDSGDPSQSWPLAFGPLPPLCWAGGSPIEAQAYAAEPNAEDQRKSVDWGNPGKQHY